MFVSAGSDTSDVIQINVGVSQGSIAGPLLFLSYSNDMSRACSVMKCVHYADDTTAFMSDNDTSNLVGSVNSERGCLDQWLLSNRRMKPKLAESVKFVGKLDHCCFRTFR